MRIRTTAPGTDDINFLTLQRLDDLPPLLPYVATCDEISAHIHAVERSLPHAAERYASLWRAFQGATPISLLGHEVPTPEVVEARAEVQALKDQIKILHENALIARSELTLAT